MSNEFINFIKMSRQSWKDLHQQSRPLLTEDELETITSLNDNINITDVIEVYLPLLNLIQIYKINQENLSFSKSLFLKKMLIIGLLSLVYQVQLQLENQPQAVCFNCS